METKNTQPLPASPCQGRSKNFPLTRGIEGVWRKSYSGFTLVELIVVITILVILGTIAFLNLWGFSGSARDSSRISNLTNLKKGLDIYQIKTGTYPMPEGPVTINASGTTILGYQGFAKDQVGGLANMSKGGTIDPSDATIFTTYSVNANQTKMQAMVFLEDSSTLTALTPPNLHLSGEEYSYLPLPLGEGRGEGFGRWFPSLIPTTFAATASDYSKRYPTTLGDGLGILLDSGTGSSKNQPVQELYNATTFTGVDIARTSSGYKAYFGNKTTDVLEGTGTVLQSLQISYLHGAGMNSPSTCPTGFISVPGNTDFNQPGFCVAKYEMTYSDADTPTSCDGAGCPSVANNTAGQTDWSTVVHITGKTPVSTPNKFPITNITQPQAITACQSMWAGYHLVTNNEWMTVARNIEQQGDNWSTGITGSGGLYRGITGEANSATSLGCDTPSSAGAGSRTYVAKPLSTDTTKFGASKTNDCDSKRQLKLSSGQIVWDMAGNVWSHVNKANSIDGSNYATTANKAFVGNPGGADAAWAELNTVSSSYFLANVLPKNTTLLKANGIGGLWFYDGTVFLRGGGADVGADYGVFTLHLYWTSGDATRAVGFRCAW